MNYIYVWNNRKNDSAHFVVKDLSSREVHTKYVREDLAEANAREVARLIMNGLPGNTVDVILGAIEQEIQAVLRLKDGAEILSQRYDVENRVRGALERLMR